MEELSDVKQQMLGNVKANTKILFIKRLILKKLQSHVYQPLLSFPGELPKGNPPVGNIWKFWSDLNRAYQFGLEWGSLANRLRGTWCLIL